MLLACVYLPLDIDFADLTIEDKVRGLVSVFPPSFTNDRLRRSYLSAPTTGLSSGRILRSQRHGAAHLWTNLLTHMECFD